MDYIWIIIGDRAGLYLELDMDLVGQSEQGSGCILSRLRRLRTVRCTGPLVKSHIYYPEHILAYGSGKTCYSLVMGSGSFRTD
jgi:hypothetical protein